ncbi:MAG: phospholipid carrier-dependent glycosyltransferase [Devosia sp.]|nr:phospholipid carrier-dependent glycosyltransferase [Devosia sp.]
MTSIVFHDHLLIFLVVATAHVLLVFAERFEAGHRDFRWLYAAAVLLGLAVLTKYNGALPPGSAWPCSSWHIDQFAGCCERHIPARRFAQHCDTSAGPVVEPQRELRLLHVPYLRALGWHDPLELHPNGLSRYAVSALLWVSPFVFPAIAACSSGLRSALRRPRPGPGTLRLRHIDTDDRPAFAVRGRLLLLEHRRLPLLFPLLAGWMRRTWVVALHLMYGLTLAVLLAVSSVVPISTLNGRSDWTLSSSFGWPEVAARVEALKGLHEVGFVATTGYQIAAELGYAMRDPDVVTISPRHDQYDYWFRPEDHLGQDALIVGDTRFGVEYVSRYFEELVPLEQVPYERFGYLIYEPAIYLGKRFRIPADE